MHFCDHYQIETARFVLRLAQEADLPSMYTIFSEPDVARYLPYDAWSSMADGDAALARARKRLADGEALSLFIAAPEGNTIFGSIVLFHFDEGSAAAEIGYVIDKQHWGRGVSREAVSAMIEHAFNDLDLRRLEASVDPRNAASHQLLLRLGFVHEGRRRSNKLIKGEIVDTNVYGLLKHEWHGAKP